MEQCDVLITYEIRNREIENLCLVKRELERRGYKVMFRMQYETFLKTPKPIDAKLVVVPGYYRERAQFYSSSHTVRTTKIVNMLWEQVFNAANEDDPNFVSSIKPWGRSVVHLAWGKRMQERLDKQWGVALDHAPVTGQIALDFLRGSLRNYYDDRKTLYERYQIPQGKRTHLFISSLAYADADMRVIKSAASNGDISRPMKFAELSIETRKQLLDWFEKILEENQDDILIYRPHPEEKKSVELSALAARQKRFLVISDESVKQWVLCCDKIYTWFSTSVAEVYAAGKGCAILRPVEMPYESDIKMFHSAQHITTYEQFKEEFASSEQKMAISPEVLSGYYYVDPDKYSYELVADAIERALKDDRYNLDPPRNNPFKSGGIFNKQRVANALKRAIVKSRIMSKIQKGKFLEGSKFRELLDNVFYVDAKLKKNYVSDEEIRAIEERIEKALKSEPPVADKE